MGGVVGGGDGDFWGILRWVFWMDGWMGGGGVERVRVIEVAVVAGYCLSHICCCEEVGSLE